MSGWHIEELEKVIARARDNAPYLNSLLDRWPDIPRQLLQKSPDLIFENIINTIPCGSFDQLKPDLRKAKQQVHLLAALCDLHRVWDWVKVTEILSQFADFAMAALIDALAKELGFDPTERGAVPGLFVLALGKYGARELNYSSDIDLIVFYDPDHIKIPNPARAEQTLVRFVRKLMRGFDEITPDGYVFRTDLRLRPDPRSNSVAVSTTTAERYYETLGQNWERAAMIKARFCGGDEQAASDFMRNVLTPFIWRRNLDYAAIADIHSIKRQIQGHASAKDLMVAGHDLKLGVGGIREIEFFAQVQQLILGGRHKDLREKRTLDTIENLSSYGAVDKDVCRQLCEDYAVLRDLEHRVQMFADEQTHIWPKDKHKRQQLAALAGANDLNVLEEQMAQIFARVHQTYSDLFPGEEDLSTDKGSLVFTGVEPEDITLTTLGEFGFQRPKEVWRHMADWLGGRIPATRTPRARELLTRLAPRIIENCAATEVPDIAFFNFADFITKLNAGVTLFSMFVNKPDALTALIDMLAVAAPLSGILSAQPALIDAMIEPDFLIRKTQTDTGRYSTLIDAETDFETSLNLVRRAVHEDQFSLMASLLKLQKVENAGEAFSKIGNAAITALLPEARKDTVRQYGEISGDYAVLGMGKLGGQELNYKSDLDLMVIYRLGDESDGNDLKYNKLTRKLVTALSSITEEGGLYEVDMALRPSGRSGPLAVRLDAFDKYYSENAWTWEYMALSRARVVAASSPVFADQVSAMIDRLVAGKIYPTGLVHDILEMHERLKRDKPSKGLWDIKGAIGGLRDIEFIAQYLVLNHKPDVRPLATLDMLKMAKSEKWLKSDAANTLIQACLFYHDLIQLTAILSDGEFAGSSASILAKSMLAISVDCADLDQVEKKLQNTFKTVSAIFDQVLKP
jgi:glutamate-ammonia-ligase adenylyltransferase